MATRPSSNWSFFSKALGALLLALVTAALTYAFTAKLNSDSAEQQRNIAAIQQFQESAARMDTSLSLLVDAILDERGVAEARKEARTAVTLHAAQAEPLKRLVGSGNVDLYVRTLGDLRRFADITTDKVSARRMAQVHVDLMAFRVEMLKQAQDRVYKS